MKRHNIGIADGNTTFIGWKIYDTGYSKTYKAHNSKHGSGFVTIWSDETHGVFYTDFTGRMYRYEDR